jgi:predicted dehydrogenase
MGYAMAYQHADAYQALPDDCELVACADIVKENAEAFAQAYGGLRIYLSYHEMLAEENLDVVSICTWPHLHLEMVLAAAGAGVKAIHCEKPMAHKWGDARLMAQECERRGVQLTFNHQRRFGACFRKAKELLEEGAIGELARVETACGNLLEYGTHPIDLCTYYNDEILAEWVIAQIDYRKEELTFGLHTVNQAYALWQYRNGVFGVASSGLGTDLIPAHNRLVGTDGVIEVQPKGEGLPPLRVKRKGSTQWETVDCPEQSMPAGLIGLAIADVVDALKTGRQCELCSRNALNATEIIFACYESSRHRGRVDLPLTIADNPLAAMVESGELKPSQEPPA